MRVYENLVPSRHHNRGVMLLGASLGLACHLGAYFVRRNQAHLHMCAPLLCTGIAGMVLAGFSLCAALFNEKYRIPKTKKEQKQFSITGRDIAKYINFLSIEYLKHWELKPDNVNTSSAYLKYEFSYAFGCGLLEVLRLRYEEYVVRKDSVQTMLTSAAIMFESLDEELVEEIEGQMTAYREDLKGFTNEDGTEDPNRNFLYCRILHVLDDFLPRYRQEYRLLRCPFSQPAGIKEVTEKKPIESFPEACQETCEVCKKTKELYDQYQSKAYRVVWECVWELSQYLTQYANMASKLPPVYETLVKQIGNSVDKQVELRNPQCISKSQIYACKNGKLISDMVEDMVKSFHQAINLQCTKFKELKNLIGGSEYGNYGLELENLKSAMLMEMISNVKPLEQKRSFDLLALDESARKYKAEIEEEEAAEYHGREPGVRRILGYPRFRQLGGETVAREPVRMHLIKDKVSSYARKSRCIDKMMESVEEMEQEGKLDVVVVSKQPKGRKRKIRANDDISDSDSDSDDYDEEETLKFVPFDADPENEKPLLDEDIHSALQYVSHQFLYSKLDRIADYAVPGIDGIPFEFVFAFCYANMKVTEFRLAADLEKICDFSGDTHFSVRRSSASSDILKEADEAMFNDLKKLLDSYREEVQKNKFERSMFFSKLLFRMKEYRENYLVALRRVQDKSDLVKDSTSFGDGNDTEKEELIPEHEFERREDCEEEDLDVFRCNDAPGEDELHFPDFVKRIKELPPVDVGAELQKYLQEACDEVCKETSKSREEACEETSKSREEACEETSKSREEACEQNPKVCEGLFKACAESCEESSGDFEIVEHV